MIALGRPSHHSGPPILGRRYINPPLPWETRMAKALKSTWEGLTSGPGGTYIRPQTGSGYEFGRWSRSLIPSLGYRFKRLGDRTTMEACREALKGIDAEAERRTRSLNKRRSRGT